MQGVGLLVLDVKAKICELDGDPDLEPSLGSYDASRYQPDAEGDSADDEPSLAATHDIDQTNWSQGSMDDSEVDELGPMARATHGILGKAQATREASARLRAIIARLSGVPAGSCVDISTTGSDRALKFEAARIPISVRLAPTAQSWALDRRCSHEIACHPRSLRDARGHHRRSAHRRLA